MNYDLRFMIGWRRFRTVLPHPRPQAVGHKS
jgi:hypothetical protein